MSFPTLDTIIEAVKKLTFADDGVTLTRTQGLWHVLMFLRHRRTNNMLQTYTFSSSYDLAPACFDLNGIFLPVKSDSRTVYYEPGATQGRDPSRLFRHREGPRQTYLNRIQTGLSGGGPRQLISDNYNSRLATTEIPV
jgi:hypothetical protein